MFIKNSFRITILLSCLLFLLSACELTKSREKIYLENAKKVATEKDWSEVISQIQKFIAIEDQASTQDKKEAWFLLSEATGSLGQLKESAEILELMIQDRAYNNEVIVEIYKRLIRLYDRSYNFRAAADTRVKLINYKKIDENEAASILLKAGLNYQNIKRYREANKIFDSALLKVKDSALKAEIYYYKAYGQTVFNEMDTAQEYLREALKSENINDKIKGQIYYLNGDIFEWKKKYSEAYENYQKALSLYPNRMFVQKRIDFLEKKHAKYLKLDIKAKEREEDSAKKEKSREQAETEIQKTEALKKEVNAVENETSQTN